MRGREEGARGVEKAGRELRDRAGWGRTGRAPSRRNKRKVDSIESEHELYILVTSSVFFIIIQMHILVILVVHSVYMTVFQLQQDS